MPDLLPLGYNIRLLYLPCPNALPRALGYEGRARWLAAWWEPGGDEAMIADGRVEMTGDWYGFLTYTQHDRVAGALVDYNLGSSDERPAPTLSFQGSQTRPCTRKAPCQKAGPAPYLLKVQFCVIIFI